MPRPSRPGGGRSARAPGRPGQARAPTTGATAFGRGRRTRQRSPLDAGGLERVLTASVVADARDLALTQHDDLIQARDEAFRSEPLEPPAAKLDEDAVAELDHLARSQPVRVRPPEQRPHDVVRVLAWLPAAFLCGMPGDVVVEVQAQAAMIRSPRQPEDLLDRLRVCSGHYPTSGSDLRIEP